MYTHALGEVELVVRLWSSPWIWNASTGAGNQRLYDTCMTFLYGGVGWVDFHRRRPGVLGFFMKQGSTHEEMDGSWAFQSYTTVSYGILDSTTARQMLVEFFLSCFLDDKLRASLFFLIYPFWSGIKID